MDQDVYNKGLAMRRKVLGEEYVDRALKNVDDFNRDFQRIVTQYCWGEAWGDNTLTPRERSILNLGMIAALGKMEEFQTHVRGALTNGLTPKEIAAVTDPDRGLLRHPVSGSTASATRSRSSASTSAADAAPARVACGLRPRPACGGGLARAFDSHGSPAICPLPTLPPQARGGDARPDPHLHSGRDLMCRIINVLVIFSR